MPNIDLEGRKMNSSKKRANSEGKSERVEKANNLANIDNNLDYEFQEIDILKLKQKKKNRNIVISVILLSLILFALLIIPKFNDKNSKRKNKQAKLLQENINKDMSAESSDSFRELRIKDELFVEVNTLELDVSEFFDEDIADEEMYFVGDLSIINLSKIGRYPIKIQHGDKIYKSVLVVEDSTIPVVEFKNLNVAKGVELRAEDFILKAQDNSKLKYEIIGDIDYDSLDQQKIKIKVSDEGGNAVVSEVSLQFVILKANLVVEAGTRKVLKKADFFENEQDFEEYELLTDLSTLRFNHVARLPVRFRHTDKEVLTYVQVVDTIAPTAQAKKLETYIGIEPNISDFLSGVNDATDLDLSYIDQVDVSNVGIFKIRIKITDEGGNSKVLSSTLTVRKDDIPPVIHGAVDFSYYPGERSLSSGVHVTDNLDPHPSLEIDKSKLNEKESGTYPLTYIAKDAAGNESRKTVNVTVRLRIPYMPGGSTGSVELNALTDSILEELINGDMNQYQQAYNIFIWTKNHITYRSQSNRTNMIQGALTGIMQRRGDAYIYRFTNQALLTRAGISNYGMISDSASHSWAMAKIAGRDIVIDSLWGYFDTPLSVIWDRLDDGQSGYFEDREKDIKEIYPNEELELDFDTVERENPDMYEGQRRTVQEGITGKKIVSYYVRIENGEEVSRRILSERIIVEPQNEIVEIGSKKNLPPEITWTGEDVITIEKGKIIDLLAGVSAFDTDESTAVEVILDDSNLDINTVGTYTIIYSAKDAQGHVAQRTREVIVVEVESSDNSNTSSSTQSDKETTNPSESSSKAETELTTPNETSETSTNPSETKSSSEAINSSITPTKVGEHTNESSSTKNKSNSYITTSLASAPASFKSITKSTKLIRGVEE